MSTTAIHLASFYLFPLRHGGKAALLSRSVGRRAESTVLISLVKLLQKQDGGHRGQNRTHKETHKGTSTGVSRQTFRRGGGQKKWSKEKLVANKMIWSEKKKKKTPKMESSQLTFCCCLDWLFLMCLRPEPEGIFNYSKQWNSFTSLWNPNSSKTKAHIAPESCLFTQGSRKIFSAAMDLGILLSSERLESGTRVGKGVGR